MKTLKTKTIFLIAALSAIGLAGCASEAEIAKETARYTNEIAQAIAAAGWKMAGAVFGGLVLHAILN